MKTNETFYADTPPVAIQVSRGVVVASIQVDLNEEVLARFRDDLLGRIHESDSRGAIFDLTGLATLDKAEFAALRQLITMCKILGTESIVVGLRPGVVSALIESGADTDGLPTAIDLDAAFEKLQPETELEADGELTGESETSAGADVSDENLSLREPEQSAGEEQ